MSVCVCVCFGKGGVEDGCVVVCLHVWVCGCVWREQGGQERKSMRSDSHSAESGTTVYQI